MCLSDIYTLGGSLQRLLSTLKINRERVPLETLKSVYRVPYEELKAQIREGVQEFVLLVACSHLLINPDYPPEEQTAVAQDAVDRSQIPKEIGKSLTRDYDVAKIHQMALKLREEIEAALWPYINQKTCLVADLEDLEKTPVIYNTLTRQIYQDGVWIDQPLDLWGKLLIYSKQEDAALPGAALLQKGETNENMEERTTGGEALLYPEP